MDWEEYKRLCERPDHFSRWALALTAASIRDPAVREALAEALLATPVAKPAGHHGGEETDYFKVDVGPDHARTIVLQVGATAAGCAGKQQRRLKHLGVVWQEYADFTADF